MSRRRPLPRGAGGLLATTLVSGLAVAAQVVAAGIQVYDITGSPLSLGLLGLAEFLPNLLLVPVAGPIADRFDRRLVASLGFLVTALSSLGLLLYALTEPTSAMPVFALVVVFGIGRAVYGPALRVIPSDIASAETLPALVARRSIASQVGQIAGPAGAGFLYAAGVPVPYAVAGGLGLAAAALVWTIPPSAERAVHTPGGRAMVRDAVEGLTVVRRSQVLLGAITLDLFAVLFGGAVALIPAIGAERLGVDEVGIGWLRAAVGIGAAAGTLVLAVRPVTRHVGKVLLASVGVFGACTMAFGATTSYVVAFAALALLSAADAVSMFVRATMVPLATPRAVRGRVLAVENVFIGASNEVGAFESGLVAALLGTSLAVVTGGAAVFVVVVVWWRIFPELRDVDRFSDLVPAPAPASPPGPDPAAPPGQPSLV